MKQIIWRNMFRHYDNNKRVAFLLKGGMSIVSGKLDCDVNSVNNYVNFEFVCKSIFKHIVEKKSRLFI